MQVLMNEQKLIGDNFTIDATTPKLTFTNNKAGEVININFTTKSC